jgi:hypothetical protein
MAAYAPTCTGWCHGLSEVGVAGYLLGLRPAGQEAATTAWETDDRHQCAAGCVGRTAISGWPILAVLEC